MSQSAARAVNGEEEGCQGKGAGGGLRPGRSVARFVKHVNLQDNEIVEAGSKLTKTWRVRNDSDMPWPEQCELVCVGGDSSLVAEQTVSVRGGIQPGTETDISVQLNAPLATGTHQMFWRLRDKASGKRFGQRLWIKIAVGASSSSSSTEEETGSYVNLNAPSHLVSPVADNLAVALQQLKEMGFQHENANKRVLTRYHGNVERAVNHLTKYPPKNQGNDSELVQVEAQTTPTTTTTTPMEE